MDKNKTEKDKMHQWACENSTMDGMESIFTPIIENSDSYYEKVENREYIRQYEPDNAADIKQELSCLWGSDKHNSKIYEQVKLICTVACMKNKHLHVYDEENSWGSHKDQLKPYIYQL